MGPAHEALFNPPLAPKTEGSPKCLGLIPLVPPTGHDFMLGFWKASGDQIIRVGWAQELFRALWTFPPSPSRLCLVASGLFSDKGQDSGTS